MVVVTSPQQSSIPNEKNCKDSLPQQRLSPLVGSSDHPNSAIWGSFTNIPCNHL